MKRIDDDEAERIRSEVDRVFSEAIPSRWRPSRSTVWHPPTDVYETDDSVVIMIEIAGLKQNEYELTLANRVLIVSGRRRDPAEKLAYHQMEIRYGEFRVQVFLPWPLAGKDRSIEATYEEGFLRIALPKREAIRVPVRYEEGDDA